MKTVFLRVDDFYLSPLTKEHLSQEYINWLNDSEVCKDNSHATFPNTEAKTLAYVEGTSDIAFAIIWDKQADPDTHIGNIALQKINWINRSAEISILIGNKDFWGKGIGTKAYSLLIDYAFQTLNLNRLVSSQTIRNKGMIKVCEKAGMTKEGIMRKALYKNGEYLDCVMFSMVRGTPTAHKIEYEDFITSNGVEHET